MEKQPLLNTYVNNVTIHEAVAEIESLIAGKKKSYVVPVNVDVIMKIEEDPYLKKITDEADMVLVDGTPLLWIAKYHGRPVKEKVSGADLVPMLCETAAKKGYTVFILGGKDGVAEKARKRLEKKHPGIRVVGTYAPEMGFESDPEAVARVNAAISAAAPDLLIACLGCPKQEKFIYENMGAYDAVVSVCAGATVDFMAENVKRAPKWMSDHGLEWFYRFTQEPKRLFKRYFVDDVQILKLMKKYR